MSILTFVNKYLLFCTLTILFFLFSSQQSLAKTALAKTTLSFSPPPIPPINNAEFKEYVRKNHTFPSPYGYEPYVDKEGKEIKFLINELNHQNAYIPVTFYCHSRVSCPSGMLYGDNGVQFLYANEQNGIDVSHQLNFQINGSLERFALGFYFPNDPKLYRYGNSANIHAFDKNIKKGDPLVTILFSQRVLQAISETVNGKLKGGFSANNVPIYLPAATGKEYLVAGTTLSVLGLGQAAGVEFSETVSQTIGETYTSQIQIGFTLSESMGEEATIGGGNVPAAASVKYGINKTLSTLITNGLEISDQRTISRTYTIKPGISDNYYWAIYQLLYSYRIHAPQFEAILARIQTIWGDNISFKIGDNGLTQDEKLIGNLLPPQGPNLANDVTVGVAVPVNPDTSASHFFFELLKDKST